ncbi:TonB-dependent siderophore receptor [Caulobacter sp. BP25]|uniref:TonB-dependent receptor n=1 Tax=Caulobacter sp. BP25 TaxID=2048900 RepID=UPI000C12ABD2|nr:TonB-dependent siderophore receptor [Caulobacter sp. BP25]PHY18427.1 TonB-dependent siderophore receptor [Caulobacter sp. BP25]
MLLLAAAAVSLSPAALEPAHPPAAHARREAEQRLDEEVIVTWRRQGFKADVVQVGMFRNRSVLDTPATVNVVTRALMDAQGVQGLEGALRNTPGITQQTTSPFNTNTFVARGLSVSASANYRLNGGLPIINYAPMPVENKQRVELLKGVSAIYYGFATPSGVLNLVTKRAGAEAVTQVYANADSEGGYGGGFDIGRSYANDTFGARVNGYAAHTEAAARDVSGHREMLTGAFDWTPSDRLSVRTDLEYYNRTGEEQGGITLPTAVNGKITLPAIPTAETRFSPEGAPFTTWGLNAVARVDYRLSDAWSVRVEGGRAEAHRDRMIATLGSVNLTTGAGRLAVTATPDQYWANRYVRAEIAGKLETGPLDHDLLLGVARTSQYRRDQTQIRYVAANQNLYNPVSLTMSDLVVSSRAVNQGDTFIDTGVYAVDSVRLGKHWQVLGGARYVNYRSKESGEDYDVTTVTPSLAAIYTPTRHTSVYASYIEGLETAGLAPDGVTNAGETMDPARSRQMELGARAEILGALASVSLFQIDRGLAYTNAANTYVLDGRARHKGVEASLAGRLTREIDIALSGQYLDAAQRKTSVAAQVGKDVVNAPQWSGSIFAQYSPARLRGLSINGGAYYTGQRYADALNLASLPGYVTYSLGAGYRWTTADHRDLTLRINADNVTDKRYWATSSTLYAGAPRTVKVSLSMDL